jgi:hypothetical protein
MKLEGEKDTLKGVNTEEENPTSGACKFRQRRREGVTEKEKVFALKRRS